MDYWRTARDANQRQRGALEFKSKLLSYIDNIECSKLGDEEGAEYVLGPDFRPPSQHNIDALRAWLEAFPI
jgi:hypothetical protein